MTDITREHPDYAARNALCERYRDLYAGGEQFRARAGHYLLRRQREPLEVYQERLNRVFYENYVGSIIDWYAATLFRREPVIILDGIDRPGKQFFNQLADDCDRKGTGLADFFRRQLVETLLAGASYTLVDFPRSGGAVSRADEEACGASRAYLVSYPADSLVNWSFDERGEYEWVVLRSSYLRKPRIDDKDWMRETRWCYYDKEAFQIYRRTEDGHDKHLPELVDQGRHGLAKLQRVPLFEMRMSEGLWLMNKAALLQLEHFNKSNALSWALTMGLFAMPVIYSDREWNQIVGESYYIQLGPEDRFGWTEPEGHVYQIAVENLSRLKDEIYRVCYLMTQAGGPLSGSQESGISKQRDFAITQEVLRAYGDAVKDTMKRVLRAIEGAREDGLQIDISGLDEFDIGDFSSELEDAERLLALATGSQTLRRQVLKKLAFKYLCDTRQEMKDQIAREIDAAGV
jgi:hypothetical protein